MKNILLIIFASILFSGCNSLQGQNKDVEEFVKIVIETYNEKNSVKFNQLINKNTGLVFITTMGSNNTWLKVHKVCLSKKCLQTNSTESIGIPYQSFLEGYSYIYSDNGENIPMNQLLNIFKIGNGYWKEYFIVDYYKNKDFENIEKKPAIREEGEVRNNFKFGEWKYYNKEGKIDSTKIYTLKDSVDVRFPHCIFNKKEPCY